MTEFMRQRRQVLRTAIDEIDTLALEMAGVDFAKYGGPGLSPQLADICLGEMSYDIRRLYCLYKTARNRHKKIHLRMERKAHDPGLLREYVKIMAREEVLHDVLMQSIMTAIPQVKTMLTAAPPGTLDVVFTKGYMMYLRARERMAGHASSLGFMAFNDFIQAMEKELGIPESGAKKAQDSRGRRTHFPPLDEGGPHENDEVAEFGRQLNEGLRDMLGGMGNYRPR